MDEQPQRTGQGQQDERGCRQRLPAPPASTERLTESDDEGQDSVEFMFNQFPVLAPHGVENIKRTNRPGTMVIPEQYQQANRRERTREHEPGPQWQRVSERMAQLGQAKQDNKATGDVMVKL